MHIHELLNRVYQQLLGCLSETRIILLHPDSKYRSILLAKLMASTDIKSYYYALGPDDMTLQSFINGLTHDLANQHPTFGRHLNMLSPHIQENYSQHMDKLLDAFALELSELGEDTFALIWDEYDHCDSTNEVQRFTYLLADRLPLQCKLVINTRTLPRLPWVSMLAKRQVVMLKDESIVTDDFYSVKNTNEECDLEIYALGPGYVLANGNLIDNWEGHLPRLLLFFALDRPVITRSEICHSLWPELDDEQAVNVFHVTKRRLHKAIGFDILFHNGAYYSINPSLKIYFDVIDFVQTLLAGREHDNPRAFQAWSRAITIYSGPFLQGHEEDWVINRRNALRTGYIEVLNKIGEAWFAKGNHEKALTIFHRAIKADEEREDMQLRYIEQLIKLGRRSEAVTHYQNFVKKLKTVYRREPNPATQQTYETIIANS